MNDRRTLIAATLVCLCAAFALRVELIAGRGAYPGHFDEAFLARKALRMLQTGDPSPHWFRYGWCSPANPKLQLYRLPARRNP